MALQQFPRGRGVALAINSASMVRMLAPGGFRAHLAVLALLLVAGFAVSGCATPGGGERGADGGEAQRWLEETVYAHATNPRGRGGVVEFEFDGVKMACVSDAKARRMRIIAPIRQFSQVSAEQFRIAMEANFHTALDARYATSRGILYAVYLHPLEPLDEAEVVSALSQVAKLARSFGTNYSSGEWVYGKPR